MKKLYRFSAIALLVLPLVFTSCSDYLDRDDDDNITEADVFARYEKVNGLVSDVYAAAKKADRPLVFFEHFSGATPQVIIPRQASGSSKTSSARRRRNARRS